MRRDELRLSRLAGLVLLTAALEAVFILSFGLAVWGGGGGGGKVRGGMVWALGGGFFFKKKGGGGGVCGGRFWRFF